MTKKLLATLSLLLIVALPALAAEKKGVELKSTAEVDIIVKNDKGVNEVIRVNAASANIVPGDMVIFTTHYVNLGNQPATAVVINNPISEHMLYVDGSAEGKGTRIDFSIDNGKTFARPDQLKIKTDAGKERLAAADEYTHIRWTMTGELAKGAKGSISYKGKVK